MSAANPTPRRSTRSSASRPAPPPSPSPSSSAPSPSASASVPSTSAWSASAQSPSASASAPSASAPSAAAAARSVTVRPAPAPSASRSPSPSTAGANASDAAVQSILKARKCWRSIKGREEAVWPPELEAALIEGLERYRPAESKSTRVLGRFPMRNKFVADHIFAATAVRRTPKQVGSRIQQLRDTNSGKHILKAISDRHYALMHPQRRDPAAAARPHGQMHTTAQLHAHGQMHPPSQTHAQAQVQMQMQAYGHGQTHASSSYAAAYAATPSPRARGANVSHVYIPTLPPHAGAYAPAHAYSPAPSYASPPSPSHAYTPSPSHAYAHAPSHAHAHSPYMHAGDAPSPYMHAGEALSPHTPAAAYLGSPHSPAAYLGSPHLLSPHSPYPPTAPHSPSYFPHALAAASPYLPAASTSFLAHDSFPSNDSFLSPAASTAASFRSTPSPHILAASPHTPSGSFPSPHLSASFPSPHAAHTPAAHLDPLAPASHLHALTAGPPRPLAHVDPTVAFAARTPARCESVFRVYRAGRAVHAEAAPVAVSLAPRSSTPSRSSAHAHSPQDTDADGVKEEGALGLGLGLVEGGQEAEKTTGEGARESGEYLYTTRLVPRYWARLCAADDPAAYTIQQQVVRAEPGPGRAREVLLEVWYHFVDATQPRAHPSSSSPRTPSPAAEGSGSSRAGSEQDFEYGAYDSPLLAPPASSALGLGLGLGVGLGLDSGMGLDPGMGQHPHAQDAFSARAHPPDAGPPLPALLQPYEDGYASGPGSPLDLPLAPAWACYAPPAYPAAMAGRGDFTAATAQDFTAGAVAQDFTAATVAQDFTAATVAQEYAATQEYAAATQVEYAITAYPAPMDALGGFCDFEAAGMYGF